MVSFQEKFSRHLAIYINSSYFNDLYILADVGNSVVCISSCCLSVPRHFAAHLIGLYDWKQCLLRTLKRRFDRSQVTIYSDILVSVSVKETCHCQRESICFRARIYVCRIQMGLSTVAFRGDRHVSGCKPLSVWEGSDLIPCRWHTLFFTVS